MNKNNLVVDFRNHKHYKVYFLLYVGSTVGTSALTATLCSPTSVLLGSSTANEQDERPTQTISDLPKPSSDSLHCDTALLDQVFWEVKAD